MSNASSHAISDPSASPTGRAEDRPARSCEDEIREKTLDKTLADSYPASDPPSTIPDPSEEDSLDLEKDKDDAA